MIYRYYMLLVRGPFGKVLTLQPDEIPLETNPDDIYLKPLERLFLPVIYNPNSRSSSEQTPSPSASPEAESYGPVDRAQRKRKAELEIYAKQLYELRRTFVLKFSPCGTIDNLSACFIWPGIVSSTLKYFFFFHSVSRNFIDSFISILGFKIPCKPMISSAITFSLFPSRSR